jgi:uncharacterized repeat protein (TIGR01451 family)
MPTPSAISIRRAASSARRFARGELCATRQVALLFLACGGLLAHPVQAAPPPGTPIDNQASATCTQMSVPIASNTVRTTVAAQIGIDLEADRSATADPGAIVSLPHTLTNIGTASDTYTIRLQDVAGDDFDFVSLLLFVDANANGVRDPGEPTLSSGVALMLAPGVQVALVVLAEVPATTTVGQVGRLQITATGLLPSSTDTNTDAVSVAAPPAPPAIGFFTDLSFVTNEVESPVGDPLFVEGRAASCNLDPLAVESSQIRLQAQITGDDESFSAVETGPDTGVFRIQPSVPTADATQVPVVAGNGVMETQGGDTVTASLLDCASGTPVRADVGITSAGPPRAGVLFVEKQALRDYVEIGEWVDYVVEVRNAGNAPLADVVVEDRLPGGFRYQKKSAQLDGHRIPDPGGGAGRVLRFQIGALAPDQSVELHYRALVGPGAAKSGDALNRAQASAGGLRSNIASARVRLVDGVFSDRGFIVGKVFADCDGDRQQDRGEPGVPGVTLYLEDGTNSRTDEDGKYNFYGVAPRTHALKVDATSLPDGARLAVLHHRFAGDPDSQFVDLKHGELHRADFALDACTEPLLAEVRDRQAAARAESDEIAETIDRELERQDPQRVERDVRTLPASGEVSRGATQIFEAARRPDQGLDARNSNRRPLPVQPSPSLPLEQLVATLDPTLGFLDFSDGSVLPGDQVSVRVKGRAGTQLPLFVNGEPVSPDRVGQRSAAPASGAQAWEYIGVRLTTGANTLELREVDGFGNARGSVSIQVVAPGELARLRIEVPETTFEADGKTPVPVTVRVEDRSGVPVTARTPITLDTSDGVVRGDDLDPVEPGLQVFAEDGEAQAALVAPGEPGDVLVRAVSGVLEAERHVRFLPYLRPLIGVGVVDAVIDWSKLGKGDLVPAQEHDAFDEEIKDILVGSDDDAKTAATRGALFLKGKIKGETLLTLRYDSEEDRYETLFRDIEPDRFYPVYGDSSTRGFDAQSTSRLYVRLDRGPSYVFYGDFVTEEFDDTVGLGAYRRGLTGVRGHFEKSWVEVDAFASHDDSTQIVEEIRGRGIAGPYDLRQGDLLENSEQVEILVRDRDQPSLVIDLRSLTRFIDYEIDWLAGTLLLREPLPSFDANLNPVFVRISYEVDSGGDEFWVTGAAARLKPFERLEIGANFVEDRNPGDPLRLLSGHFAVDIDERTRLVGEVAQSDNDGESGLAGRLDLRHSGERLDAWAYWVKSEPEFENPNSLYLNGRMEIGVKSSYRLSDHTRLVGHAIWTEDEEDGGTRRGVEAYVDQAIGRWLRGELGMRYVNETTTPASLDTAIPPGITPYQYTSARAKLTASLPWWPRLSVFGEYEQDVTDFDARVLAAGGELQVANRTRLYARHEFISSLDGRFTLNPEQDRNVTLFGIETDALRNTNAFTEYRVSDVIGGRDAEAAIGLRNRWTIAQGLTLNTAVERVQSVAGDALQNDDATAASIGVAYTRNPLWKGTGRVEYRLGETQNSMLSTFGVAAKLNDNWSVLGRSLFYINGIQQERSGGNDLVERFQLGVAYRPTDTNRWNALGRYELKYEDDSENDFENKRLVHIVSTHLDYQFSPRLRGNGRYAVKWAQETADGPHEDAVGQLLAARVTYDIAERWDVGVIGSAQTTGVFDAVNFGVGAEVGYLLTKNLWLAGGYNFFGFDDPDLADGDYSNPGAYMRLRVKFDEDLFQWLKP